MKTFIPGQIASAKDVNDNFTELSNRTKAIETTIKTLHQIKVIPYSGSANSNYLNAALSFGQTYAKPPAVWAVNTGGNTLHLVRVYATTTTGASVQFQTADRSNLGQINFNFFVMEQ